jgi:hypothetical protein
MKARVKLEMSWTIEGTSAADIGGAVRNIQDSVRLIHFPASSGVKYKGSKFLVESEVPVEFKGLNTDSSTKSKEKK